MSYLFEQFVSDTTKAGSEEELLACLIRCLGQYGYEQIVFCLFNDPDLPALTQRIGYFRHDAEDWNQLYVENDFVRIDPVVQALKAGAKSFAWDDLPKFFTVTQPQRRYMGLVADLGMHQGVAISLNGGRAAFGLSTADESQPRAASLPMASAICTHFYAAFRDLKVDTLHSVELEKLSIKEHEVLCWVASGKTDGEIADILRISQSTVDTHLRSIFRKLGAFNRVSAVMKGLKRGIISL